MGRHFISMAIAGQTPDGKVHKRTYSAFVVTHNGSWFLMTAGHNIVAVEKDVMSLGFLVTTWELNDAFAGGAFNDRAVPTDLRSGSWQYIFSSDDGLDMASAYLDPFFVRALVANGVTPIDLVDDLLRLAGLPYDRLVLAGVADETTSFEDARLRQSLFLIPIRPLANAEVHPALYSATERRIYGAIEGDGWDSSGLTDIKGTSGGPVFGVWFSEDRKTFDYAAVGIQSGWLSSSKQIAASPLDDLAVALVDAQQKEDEPSD